MSIIAIEIYTYRLTTRLLCDYSSAAFEMCISRIAASNHGALSLPGDPAQVLIQKCLI